MIIDEQAAFRSLLMHHVTACWPDAIISAYDPTTAGHLPDEFGGAGNDLVLLGDHHGEDRDANYDLLLELCDTMEDASLCAMGGMTPYPVRSVLRHFTRPEKCIGLKEPSISSPSEAQGLMHHFTNRSATT